MRRAGLRIGDDPVSRDARGDFVRVWHTQSGGNLVTVCEADDGELWYFGARIHHAWPTDPPAAWNGDIPHEPNEDK